MMHYAIRTLLLAAAVCLCIPSVFAAFSSTVTIFDSRDGHTTSVDVVQSSIEFDFSQLLVTKQLAELRANEFLHVQSISIGDGIKMISPYAFKRCADVQQINLPENLQTICSNAFAGCSNITSIAIPAGLASIEPYAFDGCASLKTIDFSSWNGKMYAPQIFQETFMQHNESGIEVVAAFLDFTSYGIVYRFCAEYNWRQFAASGKLVYPVDVEVYAVDDYFDVHQISCVSTNVVADVLGSNGILQKIRSSTPKSIYLAGWKTQHNFGDWFDIHGMLSQHPPKYENDFITICAIYSNKTSLVDIDAQLEVDQFDIGDSISISVKGLSEGVDYIVDVPSNRNAGVHQVQITGIGTYFGNIYLPYTIGNKLITEDKVKCSSYIKYTGKQVMPYVEVNY